MHHRKGVVQWCSLGGNGYLELSILKVQRESYYKLIMDSSENITEDHCCGDYNACALLQVNRRRQGYVKSKVLKTKLMEKSESSIANAKQETVRKLSIAQAASKQMYPKSSQVRDFE
ncbi:hypothetical protein TNCV_2567451 [Trichonephila clavipes]|uniref:Uncharacterized protein n=1 Tax=Trichonephila clavipes TaxID=2585209 RepID=A0A8X7BMQ5_TRICX|nr:hypothetical protein TNCV_2567451 [Trichonephila clavipes]